ncbi:MAG: hypothetical protein ABFD12_11495 [Syntrophorhabdus sp.]
MKGYTVILMSFIIFLLAGSIGLAADDLKVTKDKEGTTWSVGSEESRSKARAEEDRDKDRAWDMLQKSSIILDQRPAK